MRVSHPEADRSLEEAELRRALERAGWRHTRQRAAVYQFLHRAESHPTAEEIYAGVRRQIASISLATVYKALEALVDSGLANKLAFADGPSRYDCRGQAHYHFRCLRTGQICDVAVPYDEGLLEKLDPGLVAALNYQGFQVTGHRLEVIGYFQDGRDVVQGRETGG
jgi:Fur family transcriptional regulator, peroxide stress response regulator